MPGNVIMHKNIEFEIFQTGNQVRAVSLCDEATRCLLNVPREIVFEVVGGKLINKKTRLTDISRDIVEALSSQHLLLSL